MKMTTEEINEVMNLYTEEEKKEIKTQMALASCFGNVACPTTKEELKEFCDRVLRIDRENKEKEAKRKERAKEREEAKAKEAGLTVEEYKARKSAERKLKKAKEELETIEERAKYLRGKIARLEKELG